MQLHDTFTGPYQPGDVGFLLKPTAIEMTPVEQKKELIQSGKKHHSDVLSQEPAPTQWHLDLFYRALDRGAERLTKEVTQLATALAERFGDEPIVLASLVRAGVPLGVTLHQTLRDMGKTSWHYGVSITRDRGIDGAALDVIEERHGTSSIVSIDGWTSRGAIIGELVRVLKDRPGYPEQSRLVVLADSCSYSWLAASDDDWLIPFGTTGVLVSSLISRSVWPSEGLHGCMACEHLSEFGCSRIFVDTVVHFRKKLTPSSSAALSWDMESAWVLWQTSRDVIASLADEFEVGSVNRIKPDIVEATRTVLRRAPDRVFTHSINDSDIALLVGLAREKGIVVTEMGGTLGQYRAVTIIKKVL